MAETEDTILDELRRLPLCGALAACDPQGLAAMAAMGRVEEYPAGAVVFRLGAPADDLRFVLSGRVALVFEDSSGELRSVRTASFGDMLGWSALRSEEATWTLTARATKASRCLAFSGHALRELCERDRHFGYCLMHYAFETVAEQLADARLQALDIYGRPSGSPP